MCVWGGVRVCVGVCVGGWVGVSVIGWVGWVECAGVWVWVWGVPTAGLGLRASLIQRPAKCALTSSPS